MDNQNLTGEHRSRIGDTSREEEFTFYFPCNRYGFDERYLQNREEASLLRSLLGREGFTVDSLVIYAFSSPEGNYGHNVWLSQKRAEAVRDFVLAHAPRRPRYIRISRQEENWPGLKQAVLGGYHRANREEVLRILDGKQADAARKKALQDLDGGETYQYLVDTLMGPLRSAVFTIRWAFEEPLSRGVATLSAPALTTVPAPQELAGKPEPVKAPSVPEWDARTIFALKTNALYDAVTALNYSVEVPIGRNFSIAWQHYFPWWHTKKELKYCLQYLSLGGEARWWFAPRPRPATESRMLRDVLVGHFVGVYGFWGKTDIQWQRALGMYQCYPVWSVGLTYGYSMPISRHWNLELSLSAGYARIPYQHYIPSEDWQLLWRDPEKAGVLHYFGPTNVSVSFVRPIVIKYRKK